MTQPGTGHPSTALLGAEWSCLDECSGEQILVVAVSPSGSLKLYGLACAEDDWKSPGVFSDDTLYGTHWLSDAALQLVCPDDLDTYAPESWREDCRTDSCDTGAPVIIVAVDPDGKFHLLCTECALQVLKHPDDACNRGLALHGTHVLTDELLRSIFPDEFDDDAPH